MKIILTAVIAFIIGAVASFLFCKKTISNLRRKLNSRYSSENKKPETSKKIIWVCLINGFLWTWCSYILAYFDKPQIAESLSQVAVTEIIGVVLSYCIKSAIENLSKHNNWPDKPAEPAETENNNENSEVE